MQEALSFASHASPIALLALALLIILQLTVGKKVNEAFFGKKVSMPPEAMMEIMETLKMQNNTLLENHFKHEIPELMQDVKEIRKTVEFIKDDHGNRLTKVETILNI